MLTVTVAERAPMLSDEGLGEMFSADGDSDYQEDQQWFGGKCVRDFYEAKINSGELRVVKKVRFANGQCEEFGIMEQVMVDCVLSNFCPGCGAQIVKG